MPGTISGIGSNAKQPKRKNQGRNSAEDQSNVSPIYKWIEGIKRKPFRTNPTGRPAFPPNSRP